MTALAAIILCNTDDVSYVQFLRTDPDVCVVEGNDTTITRLNPDGQYDLYVVVNPSASSELFLRHQEHLPPTIIVRNPIDVVGAAEAGFSRGWRPESGTVCERSNGVLKPIRPFIMQPIMLDWVIRV